MCARTDRPSLACRRRAFRASVRTPIPSSHEGPVLPSGTPRVCPTHRRDGARAPGASAPDLVSRGRSGDGHHRDPTTADRQFDDPSVLSYTGGRGSSGERRYVLGFSVIGGRDVIALQARLGPGEAALPGVVGGGSVRTPCARGHGSPSHPITYASAQQYFVQGMTLSGIKG